MLTFVVCNDKLSTKKKINKKSGKNTLSAHKSSKS